MLTISNRGSRGRWFAAVLVALFLSCSPGFAQHFTDGTASLGLSGLTGGNNQAAWGDYNRDGYVDLVAGEKLWKNNGGTSFTEITGVLPSAYSFSESVWGDYNNDGLLDLYRYNNDYGKSGLILNQSTLSTTSFSPYAPFPSLPMDVSRGASWADFNNDGDLDLYVGGAETQSEPFVPYLDAVAHNNGDGTFSYTPASDNYNNSYARGITSCDWDRDGDQDVYVTNYRLVANRLFQNNGSGSFTDVAPTYNAAAGNGHGIGSAWGDIDNDGDFDLFAGNFAHAGQPESRFLENTIVTPGTPTAFTDRGTGGVDYQESYASPALGDYDNDGDLDLFFTTVYAGGTSRLYRNDGNWNFTDVTAAEGISNPGAEFNYQAAWADFDNDGDLDLVTNGKVYVNDESQTGSNHWLRVRLTGDGTTVNSGAIGTEVRITIDHDNNAGTPDITLTRQVEGGTGEGNQNDLTLHFGLGAYSGLVDLDISAAGQSWLVEDVAVDQTVYYMAPQPDLLGDLSGDGLIGGADMVKLITNWGEVGPIGTLYSLGDITGDGLIGAADYNAYMNAYGNTLPPEPPSDIPEPATIGLLLLGGLGLLHRRQKKAKEM